MHSAAASRVLHPTCYPPFELPHARLTLAQPAKVAALRRFVCSEDAPAYHAPSPTNANAYPVERSLRQADALALSLRAGLDRIAIPLARAAAEFVQRQAWSDFGFARIEDHARERFARSGRWVQDFASLGRALQSLPALGDALTGDDGGRSVGRVAALLVARVASTESLPVWVTLARRVPIRALRESVRAARAAGSAWPPDSEVPSRDAEQQSPDGPQPPTTSAASWLDAGPDDPSDRTLVSLPVPSPILAAFDEVVNLYRYLDGRLAKLLADMAERGAWSRLRFAGVGHYAEERLGVSRTSAEDRVRAVRSLRQFPLLREAAEAGRIGFESTLLVLRILGRGPVPADIERAWLARAEEATVKRLRDEARALGRTRSLRAAGLAGPDHPSPLSDAAWHASLRREPGTARERVQRFGIYAAERPSPDVFLRLRLPHEIAADFLGVVEAARQRLSTLADSVPWDESWPDPHAAPSMLAARTFSERSRRVPGWVGLLALLEDFVLTWDPVRSIKRRRAANEGEGTAAEDPTDDSTDDPADDSIVAPARESPVATARVSPAAPKRHGDPIYSRAGWRCMAPGCTSRKNLDDHHVIYRSRRGPDSFDNRECICRFHHNLGEHGELASCRGKAPLGILWRLGKKDVAVWYRNERRVAAPQADAPTSGSADVSPSHVNGSADGSRSHETRSR